MLELRLLKHQGTFSIYDIYMLKDYGYDKKRFKMVLRKERKLHQPQMKNSSQDTEPKSDQASWISGSPWGQFLPLGDIWQRQ